MTFKKFLKNGALSGKLTGPKKDFAEDTFRDPNFKEFKTLKQLKKYLVFKRASPKVAKIGEACFKLWKESLKPKKIKLQKTDGLGPYEIKKIRQAVRQVWHRSHARKLCALRCVGPDGFDYCENCGERTPQLKIDHIKKVGAVDGGFLERMFTPSKNLQGLCKTCHDFKTKQEKKQAAEPDGFY